MKLTSDSRLTLTTSGEFVARPTYWIPRDRTCWYCERGQYERCPWPATCACWTCYGKEMKKQAGGTTAEATS